MSINNVEMQDSAGNIYYPHTDADIVKFGETTVGASLSDLTKKVEGTNIATDANTCGVAGKKTIHNTTLNTLNAPYKLGLTGEAQVGFIETYLASATFGVQIYYVVGLIANNKSATFIRSLNNGVWTDWSKFATTKSLRPTLLNGWKAAWDSADSLPIVTVTGNVANVTGHIYGGSVANGTVIMNLPIPMYSAWKYAICQDRSIGAFYLKSNGDLCVDNTIIDSTKEYILDFDYVVSGVVLQ